MKKFIYPSMLFLFLTSSVSFLTGCQKEEDITTPKPSAKLCPEINMQNFDEVERIIATYLKYQKDSSADQNLSDLQDWLSSSGCISRVHLYKSLYDTFPPQLSMHLDFSDKHPASGADLYLYVHDNGHLSIASFLYSR